MIRLIIGMILCSFAMSQYVLDRGLYIGAGVSGTNNYLFQTTGFETDNEAQKSFRGTGNQFEVGIIYAHNRCNFFEITVGRTSLKIKHESVLFDNNFLGSRLNSSYDFTEISTLYSYVFPSMNLIFGGGTKIYIPPKTKEDFDLFVNGELHIGLKYQFSHTQVIPYTSYSFPISNLKRTGSDLIKIGSFHLGLKVWFKFL